MRIRDKFNVHLDILLLFWWVRNLLHLIVILHFAELVVGDVVRIAQTCGVKYKMAQLIKFGGAT